eukprot:1141336-Pelagomonas_calceolata.AAC.1
MNANDALASQVKTREGKQADDAALVSNLNVKPGAKVMMMGTPEVAIRATEEAAQAAPEVQDDFDIGPEDAQSLDVKDQPEVQVGEPGRVCGT